MFCTYCGANIKQGNKFCTSCGYQVVQDSDQIDSSGDDFSGTTVLEDLEPAVQESSASTTASVECISTLRLTTLSGKVFNIKTFPAILGKGSNSDIQISGNNAISRQHLLITQEGSRISVTDLDSSNYTYLNGVKLEPQVEFEIKHGDTLKIADEPLAVEITF